MQPVPVKEEQSLGELFSKLSADTGLLVRQEVELAKAEMAEKARAGAKQAGLAAFGGALAYVGLFAIVAAIIALLAQVLPLWLAALIVGVVVVAAGALLARNAAGNLAKIDLAPAMTVRSLKENKEWLQTKLS
jgi:hypothetical protein